MNISVKAAMRSGLVSGKAAAKWKKPAILKQTRSQHGRMADFDGRHKDEGVSHGNKGELQKNTINNPKRQRDRVSSAPSHKTGGAGFGAATRGSKSPQGGAVSSSYVPGRQQIDHFPKGQAKVFPANPACAAARTARSATTRK